MPDGGLITLHGASDAPQRQEELALTVHSCKTLASIPWRDPSQDEMRSLVFRFMNSIMIGCQNIYTVIGDLGTIHQSLALL